MTRRVGSPFHCDRVATVADEPSAATAWSKRSGRRRGLVALVAVTTLLGVGCGEDANDAPGGSAPPTSTGASGVEGSAPGPGGPVTAPSAEHADEGHPTVPAATAGATAGD